MIWLASFPRSGNTYFRIVLYEVYGIESSAFHLDKDRNLDPDYASYPVVKTHLLPEQLAPDDPSIPGVYLVRDGRDALISMAHQREDLLDPETSYLENLRDMILPRQGEHFGGWSRNVAEWLERAALVIKFEELIEHPIECIERMRPLIDLPPPLTEKLPTFDDLKTKNLKYGSGGEHLPEEKRQARRDKFFRRGVAGAWKDEMPDDLHELFWRAHGDVMQRLGYTDGMLEPRPRLLENLRRRLG